MTMLEPRLPLSYVTRREGRLVLQLQLEDDDASATPSGALLRLREVGLGALSEPVPVTTSDDPNVFTAELPSAALVNGIWQVELARYEDDEFEPVHARVLVCDPNPISLLLGPMPVPHGPARANGGRRGASGSQTQQVARALGGVVDRVLVELPPKTARELRGRLRKVARRVLR
ncbi:MAG TPA: hypothetical protein VFL99_12100 [Segeticoccus sp.]|uniref:hypothetical protein n=1 Tax=Segeticoccus sp. TaxID=2706531 RepID=UPI002D80967D|nr:hypothetical protein [Segeticoccus sp.]HET8601061.1 hypothetical protein [Segeticoccus sp.]